MAAAVSAQTQNDQDSIIALGEYKKVQQIEFVVRLVMFLSTVIGSRRSKIPLYDHLCRRLTSCNYCPFLMNGLYLAPGRYCNYHNCTIMTIHNPLSKSSRTIYALCRTIYIHHQPHWTYELCSGYCSTLWLAKGLIPQLRPVNTLYDLADCSLVSDLV